MGGVDEPVFNPAGTVSVQIALAMGAHAAALGLDLGPVLEELGITPLLSDVDGRIDARVAVELWRRASALSGDPCYGLHVAEVACEGAGLSLGGHLLLASRNMRDALSALLRLERSFHDVKTSMYAWDEAGVRVRLRTRDDPIPVPAVAVHCVWAFCVFLERRATGAEVRPVHIAFEHPPPGDPAERDAVLAEFRRVFGVTPTFDAEANEIVFSARDLDRPHRTANLHLASVLEAHAVAALAKLPAAGDTVSAVRKEVLARLIAGEDPSLPTVARALGTSPRTLQRRLAALGTSHVEVVDGARSELARRYVLDRSLPLVEVAYALGFSDQTAFHRAFVRWTGSAPGAYRRRGGADAPEGGHDSP